MPSGIYTKTEEHKKKLSKSKKELYLKEPERKIIISKQQIGKKLSEETRRKMSESRKGKKHSEEWKRNIGLTNSRSLRGYKHTIQSRLKMSKAKNGHKVSEETREKISKSKRRSDGISKEHRLLRALTKWKEWRLIIFSRDNYTCQHCFKRGIQLHPHHIIPIKECIKLNKREEIFNPNNGITLCVECHLKKGLHRGR